MNDTGQAKATDPLILERLIMDSNRPKSEHEWWAAHEIERLREALLPFALAAVFFDQRYLDTDPLAEYERHGSSGVRIEIGDLRNAKRAFRGESLERLAEWKMNYQPEPPNEINDACARGVNVER